MGDRRNFLDADNCIMEQNLRFVQSDLEQNLNKYFSGESGGARGSGAGRGNYDQVAPPRDYKVVQPIPGDRYGPSSRGGYHPYSKNSQQFSYNVSEGGYTRSRAYGENKDGSFRTSSGNSNGINTGSNNVSGRKRRYSERVNEDHTDRKHKLSHFERPKKVINKASYIDKPATQNSSYNRNGHILSNRKNRGTEKRGDKNHKIPTKSADELRAKVGNIKPPEEGHLKYEPEKYWTEWWSKYAYIEQAIDEMDENEEPIKSRLKFKGISSKIPAFLILSIVTINRNLDINEVNYENRDIYKVLLYKRQLENPNFQKRLKPKELEKVERALKAINKRKLALMYQSLIRRWDVSMDLLTREERGEEVKSRLAHVLINDKAFHYLVLNSLRELKKLTAEDWPGFEEFYKTL